MEDNNPENSDFVMKSSSTGKMILFAFPRIGSSLLLGVVGYALFLLYTSGYGLDEARVSFIISIGYIAIAISQFLFGWLSDVTYLKKLGGKKPYVLILAPILVISFIFLLMPGLVLKDAEDTTLLIWLGVWNTLFQISYAVTTPYQAFMATAFSVEDRPKCSQIQNIFNFIGQASQTLFSMIILTGLTDELEEYPEIVPPELFWTCIIFGFIFIASFYISAILMPVEPKPIEKPNMIKNLKVILSNWNYLSVTLMAGIASVGWVIVGTVMLTFLEEVLFLGTMEYIIMAATLIIGMIVFLAIWRKIIKKNGKKRSIIYVFLAGAIFMPISLLGLINWTNPVFFAAIFVLGLAGVMGGWYLFPYIMYADLAEDDQRRTNVMKAGIYTGFPSIVLNLLQALGTFILGLLFEYLPDVMVGTNEIPWAMVLWGPVCTFFLILAIIFTKFFVKLDFEWEKKD
ncbi:MFS transporter [Promethearchaeum syntrophicum]|uniref:MFS transporter n=1 Tax=Promethearchaeum syntrophicum TaxID=2594042 RepID=A0A5B9DF97_9ARCH|nr:MFS transporter [Candidatus Prometheoarchaeum syntrophicum]QEE17470.1 Major Facilitator Superfamily protein [Candidatus Prometheoarchaeum syntrophicum]